jgi:hypothetical protein
MICACALSAASTASRFRAALLQLVRDLLPRMERLPESDSENEPSRWLDHPNDVLGGVSLDDVAQR